MPIVVAGTNGMFIQDDDGTRREFALRVVGQNNLIEVAVFDGDGVELGTPIRFHMTNSGHRIAADLPSVNSASFITENGHIANG